MSVKNFKPLKIVLQFRPFLCERTTPDRQVIPAYLHDHHHTHTPTSSQRFSVIILRLACKRFNTHGNYMFVHSFAVGTISVVFRHYIRLISDLTVLSKCFNCGRFMSMVYGVWTSVLTIAGLVKDRRKSFVKYVFYSILFFFQLFLVFGENFNINCLMPEHFHKPS